MKNFPALDEVQGQLAAKRKELADIFAEATPGGEGTIDLSRVKRFDTTQDAVDAIRALNDELADLGEKEAGLKAVARAAEAASSDDAPAGTGEAGGDGAGSSSAARKGSSSIGEAFLKSRTFKDRQGLVGPESQVDIDVKALFTTTAGWEPETTRGPRVVESAQRPVQMIDVIPTTTTAQVAVTYMEETTFTNAAAETAEGAAKPEAALALEQKSADVRKIAVWLPVTEETLEDEPRVRGYLDNRLPFMIRQRLDGQIVAGNGTAPNLRGLLNVNGIQTQAKGTDPVPDAIYKAMTKVEVVGQAMPDTAVFHPNDWSDVRLLRTSDGIYIWGNPSEAGPERIWGLQVVKVQAATENTAIVGDFGNFTELAIRKGITMAMTDSHGTFFVENKYAIRAEMRAAFVVYRPTAVCQVTGV